MPSLLMRYAPEPTDAGLTARDQLIALSRVDGLALAYRPLPTLKNRLQAMPPSDPVELALSSVEVDPTAPELVIWDRYSEWDQGARRRTLLIPDLSDGHWNDIARNCDEVLCTPNFVIEAGSTEVVPDVVLEPDGPATGLPEGKPIAYVHVQHGRDTIGFSALIRAWFETPEMANWALVVSTDAWQDSIKLDIRAFRREAREHTVAVVNDSRPGLLDALVMASDMVICCHTMNTVGWRPIAMKAALAGKPLTSTTAGIITEHVVSCRWVQMPPANMDGLTPRTMTSDGSMSMQEYREIHKMLVVSFQQAFQMWDDHPLGPVSRAWMPFPSLTEHIMGGQLPLT